MMLHITRYITCMKYMSNKFYSNSGSRVTDVTVILVSVQSVSDALAAVLSYI